MRKIKFFAFVSVMLFLFSLVSVIRVNAASEFNFVADYAMTGENNVFTLDASKGCIRSEVSDVDLSGDVYFSIKYESTSVRNFDISVYGEGLSAYADVVYKMETAFNKTEYVVTGNVVVATANVTSYLNANGSSYNGITNLTHVKVTFRGATGDVVEMQDFAITNDGNHGFETAVEPEQPVEPEVPAEKIDYVITTDGNATVEGNVYTLTATRALLKVDLSNVAVDTSSVFVSLKYKITADAEGFETKAAGDGGSDTTVSGVVAPNSAVGNPWNLVEHEITANYSVATLNITTYVSAYAKLDSFTIRVKGAVGTTFEIFDFAITTDGAHGFQDEQPSEPEQPVEPEVPVGPIEYVFTNDGNVTVDGNVYTMTSTRALLTCDVTAANLDVTKLYVSVKYNMSSDAEGFETRVSGIDATGATVESRDVAGVVAPSTSKGNPWNLVEHVNYGEFIVSTVQIDNYTSDLQAVTAIIIRLKGVEGTTFELLDFNVTTDGVHGFELPMNISAPVGDDVTVEEVDGIYELSYDNSTPSWRNIEIAINNYKPVYDSFNLSFYANAGTNMQIELHYVGGKVTLRSHWAESGVVTETGELNLSYSLEELGLKDAILTKVVVYLDNPTEFTTNTGVGLVKLLKCEVVSLDGIIAAAKEEAIKEVNAAIGEYEISVEEYVAAINEATTLEAVAQALANAKEVIEAKKAEIDQAAALESDKQGSILLLEMYIEGYEGLIDITSYKTSILNATTQAEVEEIFGQAQAYVLAEIERIDLENAFAKVVAEAVKELTQYKEAELYREAEQVLLAQAIEDGKAAINAAADETAVAQALANAKSVIDAIKTKEAYEAEEAAAAKALADAKAAAIAKVEAAIGEYAIDKASYEAAINAAATVEAVTEALLAAEADIETKKAAIDEAAALAQAKSNASEELEAYKAAELYREAEQALLAQAIADGKVAINAAADEAAVAQALANAKSVIDAIKTKAAYEAEEAAQAAKALADAKAAAKAVVESEIGEYAIDKATYEAAIDQATTLEEVAQALANAKTDITAKKAAIDAEINKPVEEPKKGCKGSVIPSILGVVTLLGACLTLRKKEQE